MQLIKNSLLPGLLSESDTSSDMSPREMSKLFKLLSAEFRLGILRILHEKGALNVAEITNALRTSQPNISHNLKALRLAGILDMTRCGKEHYYRLSDLGREVFKKTFLEFVDAFFGRSNRPIS